MRDALNRTGRGIFFALANTDPLTVGSYGPTTANSWGTSQYIRNGGWENVRAAFSLNNEAAALSKKGAWNDPDSLDIGTGKLSLLEEKTQFALYALAKAPLILSSDLASLSSQ
jgi:alpha-galactosidase